MDGLVQEVFGYLEPIVLKQIPIKQVQAARLPSKPIRMLTPGYQFQLSLEINYEKNPLVI
jgi:hypothetical protein